MGLRCNDDAREIADKLAALDISTHHYFPRTPSNNEPLTEPADGFLASSPDPCSPMSLFEERQCTEPEDGDGDEDEDEELFQFRREKPSTLTPLARWLGLRGDVETALLLNEEPVQRAFGRHRAPRGRRTVADDPALLERSLDSFILPRDLLPRLAPAQPAAAAALFAHDVLPYLERTLWAAGPAAGDDVKTTRRAARRRWAIALHMFWFLERAFSYVD